MKTIRESECVFDALSEQELCPVIQEMADRIAEELDLCAEFDFEYGEEDVIVGLSREFYRRGAFREGVGLLLLSFSLIENGEAAMMLLFLQKVCTERAEEKRAVPMVGRTWFGPAK